MAKLQALWLSIKDSLWFVPGLLTLAGVGLALLMVHIDERVGAEPLEYSWVFGGGAESALSVLSAIAMSLITVTGVIFSVTIVALQLASSQYTPRVLRNFTADRANQMVLGVFIGTFTYALLVQRRVYIPNEQLDGFVPSLSVTLAVLLAVISMGCLIYFIDHMARAIQAPILIERAAKEALSLVERIFPEPVGEPLKEDPPPQPPEGARRLKTSEGGYLQAVDEHTLFGLKVDGELFVRMEVEIGEFVVPGAVVASAWPTGRLTDEVADEIRNAFVLGPQRTAQQDAEFGMIELVDIAVKALSPSINDPETAKNAIDRVVEVLAKLGQRQLPKIVRREEGSLVCFIARRVEYDQAVALGFEQIRHFGARNPAIAERMLEGISKLAEVVPPHRHAPLLRELELILGAARREIEGPSKLEVVERSAAEALERLQPGWQPRSAA